MHLFLSALFLSVGPCVSGPNVELNFQLVSAFHPQLGWPDALLPRGVDRRGAGQLRRQERRGGAGVQILHLRGRPRRLRPVKKEYDSAAICRQSSCGRAGGHEVSNDAVGQAFSNL